ncbi:MAG: hypothetical protein LBV17_02590 [Treponema sp.]|jgi:hypothetical protein|nr:hypothetical protein [Treponema sp.]
MKRIIFIIVFLLFATVAFTQVQEPIYTSEKIYYVSVLSPLRKGKYCGLEQYRKNMEMSMEVEHILGKVTPNIQLSNDQIEVVKKVLSRVNTIVGDTFFISIFFDYLVLPVQGGQVLNVYCEFTSNTRFNYWAFKQGN